MSKIPFSSVELQANQNKTLKKQKKSKTNQKHHDESENYLCSVCLSAKVKPWELALVKKWKITRGKGKKSLTSAGIEPTTSGFYPSIAIKWQHHYIRWPKSVTAQTRTSRHKRKLHGTNKNFTAQAKTSRHKQELHGTNENFTAQTRTSRHKRKLHGTNKNSHGTNKNSHGTNKNSHGTIENFTAQTKTSRHKQKLWRRKLISRRKWLGK